MKERENLLNLLPAIRCQKHESKHMHITTTLNVIGLLNYPTTNCLITNCLSDNKLSNGNLSDNNLSNNNLASELMKNRFF